MTSWPWMKGVSVGIADPIDPLNDHDKRESVKDIIEKHAPKIKKVKQAIQDDPLYDPNKHDDLWIVRFILSNRKTDPSVKAIKNTLRFREQHNLDATDLRYCIPRDAEQTQKYLACCDEDGIQYLLPDPQRGVVGFLRAAGIHQYDLLANLTIDEWIDFFMYTGEWTHQWLDYITRTTGRLTKSVRLLDMSGMKFSEISYEVLKRAGEAVNICEGCYPQLLDSVKICNPPQWIHIPWMVCRVFTPKRVIDKIDFVCPAKNPREKRSLLQHVDEEHLPESLGGKNKDWPLKFSIPKQRVIL